MLGAWRHGTQEQYKVYIDKWTKYCALKNISVFEPQIVSVLDFLHDLVENESYSTLNTVRSALSTIIVIDSVPVGQHHLVCRFMKAVFNDRPCIPKNLVVWDVDIVLNYLKSLSPVRSLSLKLLTQKLTMLLLLLSGQRGQTIRLLNVQNMTLTYSRVSFRIGEPIKQTRPGRHIDELSFKAYAPDRRLCVITVLKHYLERTLDIRGVNKQLLLTTHKPIHGASRDSIRRWTREVLSDTGIDMSIFNPHSTRAASTSKAAASNLPIQTILDTAGWTRESTFRKYYKKPVAKSDKYMTTVLRQ